ncbi:MAG: tRNA uridine-5-carboxymethylaminomethyl(34) synthesis GTPase MnmE [Rhodospirillales bacterium]|nr:tRNA uridine-5-carboxymethylaminomethyl(34) synthesis GTPase MnmE [Rhodospirillales bacterium]
MGNDTIFAPASGAGAAAIAVLRLSGPDSARILAALAGRVPPPRRASLRALRDAAGTVLDRAVVLWLPGPDSYTGEDGAELHVHGGRAVIAAVADALLAAGARPAEPGEFTRRAFLNGKLDLVAAEAVADLVAAETEAQRRQAMRQLDGALGDLYRGFSDRLAALLAREEALIDFPDEDLPPALAAEAAAERAALAAAIAAHLADGRRGEKLREGLVFAISGPPNVGKSSLMNALAGRDVAIVSPIPGTTRDALEARVVLGGVPVTVIDTAGLRETADPIEAEGVRRARARAEAADLVIAIDAAGAPFVPPPGALAIANKNDLGGGVPQRALGLSLLTGAGMDDVVAALEDAARRLTDQSGPPPLTRARHRAALEEAASALTRAGDAALPELRAEDLRQAMRALGRITGAVGVEDLLDRIFAAFCIGK